MKILGVGIDIIHNKRMISLIKKKIFISKIFGKNEIILSKKYFNKTSYFAKRFAAKEAFAKSIGTGFRKNLNFKDIQILNDKLGKPYYYKSKKLIILLIKDLRLKSIICFFQFLMKKIIQLRLQSYKPNNVK